MGLFDFLLPKERRVERLWKRAMQELEACEFASAVKTAHELERLRFTGAFEVEARALAGLDRGEEAVAVLERGLAKVPDNARLWEQLGIQCSDLERWERAHEAFAKARRCVDVSEPASIAVNDALVWLRQGEPERAESTLADAPATTDGELASRIESLRATCELEQGRSNDALQRVDRWLASALARDSSVDTGTRAFLFAVRARALHATGTELDRVHEAIDRALSCDKSVPEAAELLRTLEGRRSARARRWRLLVQGVWTSPGELGPDPGEVELVRGEMGFFATYFVVANCAESALELCRRFEPPNVRASLRLESAEDLGAATDELLGVERAHGGYSFFSLTPDS